MQHEADPLYAKYVSTIAHMQGIIAAVNKEMFRAERDASEALADKNAQFKRWQRDVHELQKMKARITAVKRLHRRHVIKHQCEDGCILCAKPECVVCRRNWPCPTYKAVITDGDLDADV